MHAALKMEFYFPFAVSAGAGKLDVSQFSRKSNNKRETQIHHVPRSMIYDHERPVIRDIVHVEDNIRDRL